MRLKRQGEAPISTSARRLYLFAVTAFGWFALALLYLTIERTTGRTMPLGETLLRFASFFTVMTNLLVAVLLTLTLLRRPEHSPRPGVMTAATVYIVIVGLVYFTLLRNTWAPHGAELFADIALHYVMPAAMLLYWLAFVPKGTVRAGDPLWWLIYPLAYLAFTLMQGPRVGWYPYPFVDVSSVGYQQVAINAACLFALFLAMGYGFFALDHVLARNGARQTA